LKYQYTVCQGGNPPGAAAKRIRPGPRTRRHPQSPDAGVSPAATRDHGQPATIKLTIAVLAYATRVNAGTALLRQQVGVQRCRLCR
jgi:hypothetical protein